jgi:hypothetical protein
MKNGEEVLAWRVQLWRKNPQKLAGLTFVSVIAGLLGFFFLHGLLGFVLGFCIIWISVADFWMPLHFQINGTEASRRCGISVTSLAWDQVKRVYEVPGGLKLTPLEEDGRLEAFRGVTLLYDGNAEEVREAVARLSGKDVRLLEE